MDIHWSIKLVVVLIIVPAYWLYIKRIRRAVKYNWKFNRSRSWMEI